MATFLGWLANSFLGAFLKELAAAVLQGIQQQQQRADQIALGQKSQLSADAVNALKVQARMAELAARPRDIKATIGALNAGTF